MREPAVDLNADVGEGHEDEVLMPYLTSVSIACGGHAGDSRTMTSTLKAAKLHGLRAGAHPSYPDRAGFGRVAIDIAPAVLAESLQQQLAALAEIATREGVRLTHVKAHGALYNRAWRDLSVADVVVDAVAAVDRKLKVFCPPGSAQERAALAAGLTVLREVFLDRGYTAEGTLIARGEPGDIISSSVALAQQITNIARLEFETVCVHGDNPAALELLKAAPALLAAHGWKVAPYPIEPDAGT